MQCQQEMGHQEKAVWNEEGELLNLHVIDLGRDDDQVRRELMQQLSSIGFLVLTNVAGYDEAAYMDACQALHALPEQEKRALYLRKDEAGNNNVYRGYQPFKPNDPSHKEFFDQGLSLDKINAEEQQMPLYEVTPFPGEAKLQWIERTFETTFAAWYQVARRVMSLLAVGLGKPSSFFDAWYEDGSLTTMRTIHYLPRSAGLVDSSVLNQEESKLTTPEHADSGFLTFLATFGYPGLQVFVDGEYRSAVTPQNALVVNVGDLLARLSGYRLKATFHRVLDIGRERFSSPMFLEPKYTARIPKGLLEDPSLTSAGDAKEGPCFGDWLIRRVCASYVEWRGFEIPADRKPLIDAIRDDFCNATPRDSPQESLDEQPAAKL
mmetsp:Transcript_87409/g.209118  ORF Transcript_87409/g.209118 Transcript_87409/m.209118 type:complete len:378 (+) Transcript_87409:27-1160(+)